MSDRVMSSSTGVPLHPGPMDVEDSIPALTSSLSGDNSSNTINGANKSSSTVNNGSSNPEIATGSGGGSSEVTIGLGSSPPPPPTAAVTIAMGEAGSAAPDGSSAAGAPDENAEAPAGRNAVPAVELVPLPPNFDLDAYISRYGGYTKLRRLEWIAQRCSALAPDCYRASLALLRQGINTQSYREICVRASQLMGPEYAEDTEWAEQVDRRYQQSVEKLEAELNSYKTNLIKESIRMGYNDFGDLSYRRGDLKQALKCYARTRDYCTTNRHSAEMCLHVIEISADMRNFIHVNNYVLKAEHTPDLDAIVVAKLRAAAGLVYLDQREYAKAARKFVEVSPELGSSFDGVVAPEDIAVYGGLCALATFSREEMKRKVLDNASFKNFLDLVPQMRELMNDFANSRYKPCLTYLANLKPDLQLDLHLHMHLDRLYKMVEDKCLMQYFSPYTSVRLGAMSEAFGMEVSAVEEKVAALIISNQISARIDSTNATLHAKHTEQRGVSCRKMHEMGEEFKRELRAMLLRMSCIECDFVVRSRGLGSLSPDLQEDDGDVVLGTLEEGVGSGSGAGAAGVGRGDNITSSSGAVPAAGQVAAELPEEEGAGGADAERPPEAGGGSSSMATSGQDDAMDTVS